MGYERYTELFGTFATDVGYAKACQLLAFENNHWHERSLYRSKIGSFLDGVLQRKGSLPLAADVCCGEYAWISREFEEKVSSVYCIDISPHAVNAAASLSTKVVPLISDAAEALGELTGIEALYCGFNVYADIVEAGVDAMSAQGGLFLMKPVSGDDLSMRETLKGEYLSGRAEECGRISSILSQHCTLSCEQLEYHWTFADADIDAILAALSVVSFGDRSLLSQEAYEWGTQYLSERTSTDGLTLQQRVVIWEAVKQ